MDPKTQLDQAMPTEIGYRIGLIAIMDNLTCGRSMDGQ
jgi:hypothetical protein